MAKIELTYTAAQDEVFFNNKEKYIVVPKGRRTGITRGAAHAFIEHLIDGIQPLLWVDTINGNIDRYFERYFQPALNQLPNGSWEYHKLKKELKIFGNIMDFRSADAPESIEGFGYKKIFLNEAGIILKNDYLYSNAILPMLMDYSDSQLIAAGVPKGKIKRDGTKHKFYELYERALAGEHNYRLIQLTSFDNPFLNADDIREMQATLTDVEQRQEIMGEFLESDVINPFFSAFDRTMHISDEPMYDKNKRLYISIDFNLNPFSVSLYHMWRDQYGEHLHCFDEIEIFGGSIPKLAEILNEQYYYSLPNCYITGDAMGNRGDISQMDNASLYTQLVRLLKGVNLSQLYTPPNPTHENSRADCNYFLTYFPDFKIHPKCKGMIRDMQNMQVDVFGSIIKRNRKDVNQLADFGDNFRYMINTFGKPWIETHSKGFQYRKR